MRRGIVIAVAVLFLSSCATLYNPATGRKEFIIIDSRMETAIGKNVSYEITRRHSVSQEKDINQRLLRVSGRLSGVSDRKDIQYQFFVLADKELNAVSLPGGFIYVNKGLMDALNDDELAFVVGHELGHTAARHAVKKIQSNMAYQLILGVAFASIGNKAAGATDIASGINTIYNLIELGYSREDEYEADRLGVKYAFKAGFNPSASLSSLQKIKKEAGPDWKVLGYLRTHPYIDQRMKALKGVIPTL